VCLITIFAPNLGGSSDRAFLMQISGAEKCPLNVLAGKKTVR
jgi:hypothetical protein